MPSPGVSNTPHLSPTTASSFLGDGQATYFWLQNLHTIFEDKSSLVEYENVVSFPEFGTIPMELGRQQGRTLAGEADMPPRKHVYVNKSQSNKTFFMLKKKKKKPNTKKTKKLCTN